MSKSCFLSHAHEDAELARSLASLIQRVSLQNIRVWHSSDQRGDGGVTAGQSWIDAVRRRLSESAAVIALVTPTSITQPWLYFESGFVAANSDLNVIPVCIGFTDVGSIPMPLAMYQCYLVATVNDVSGLLEKLFARFGVPWDAEMASLPIRSFIDVVQRIPGQAAAVVAKNEMATRGHELLKEHIDRRFFELAQMVAPMHPKAAYRVSFSSELNGDVRNFTIEVDGAETVANILDFVWSEMRDLIKPYTYMEDWILEEEGTGRRLILKEFQNEVPAHAIFAIRSKWRICQLAHSYFSGNAKNKENPY